MLVLWPLGRGFHVGQGQPLPSIVQGYLPGRSYKVIHGVLLFMLDLEASGRDYGVSEGWLPSVQGLEQLCKKTSASQGLWLPASCPYDSTAGRAFW